MTEPLRLLKKISKIFMLWTFWKILSGEEGAYTLLKFQNFFLVYLNIWKSRNTSWIFFSPINPALTTAIARDPYNLWQFNSW